MPRMYQDLGDSTKLLLDPTETDLHSHFEPHVAARILSHLDPETGDAANPFEVQCVSVASVLWMPWSIHVVYRTKRRVGNTAEVKDGLQFLVTRHFREVMRALVVTADGRVVMQREHRRTLGRWMDMHCAGGTRRTDPLGTLISEMISETGCRPSAETNVWRLRRSAPDDGPAGEPLLNYLAIDRVTPPEGGKHICVEDNIKGILLIPFDEWRERALDGEYDDPYSENFAARCTYDQAEQRIAIRGRQELLRGKDKE
ncbi:hypothetical protein EPN90_00975 [Patescibacteria group bacterium]|nr:MAG: hypothetical protein EPN90_00975 [Patescibacteria group bacterium]